MGGPSGAGCAGGGALEALPFESSVDLAFGGWAAVTSPAAPFDGATTGGGPFGDGWPDVSSTLPSAFFPADDTSSSAAEVAFAFETGGAANADGAAAAGGESVVGGGLTALESTSSKADGLAGPFAAGADGEESGGGALGATN